MQQPIHSHKYLATFGGGGWVGKENNQHSWQKLSTESVLFPERQQSWTPISWLCRVQVCHCACAINKELSSADCWGIKEWRMAETVGHCTGLEKAACQRPANGVNTVPSLWRRRPGWPVFEHVLEWHMNRLSIGGIDALDKLIPGDIQFVYTVWNVYFFDVLIMFSDVCIL